MGSYIVDINAAGKVLNDKKEVHCIYEDEMFTEVKRWFRWSVEVRNRAKEKKSKKGNDIPVTVRQLEAVIRMSEAIAKMELSTVVTKKHVDEEARILFELSTMSAAKARKEFGLDIPTEMRGRVLKWKMRWKGRYRLIRRFKWRGCNYLSRCK